MKRRQLRNLAFSGVIAACLLSACSKPHQADEAGSAVVSEATANDPTAARIVNASSNPDNWLSTGRGYDETRHSPLTQISSDNVSKLGLQWFYDFDTHRGQEATPLFVDGTLYTTSAWSKVQAFDAVSGKLLWQFDPKVPGEFAVKGCCDVINRGVAYWGGKLFLGTLDGRLIAIDAKSGQQLWSTVTVDQAKNYTITGAPRVVKGRVLIGNGGAEFGVRGYLSAYDAESGKLAWRFYTVPGKTGEPDGAASDAILQKAAKSWTGDWWSNGGGGGGTVWDSMAYDPKLDLLFFGTGNGSYWNQDIRSPQGGDNLFVGSIVAVRPETGEYVWHFQETPGDQWDYTSTQHMILTDMTIGGAQRRVILHAPKNGFFYIIDAKTGKFLSGKNYVPVNWTSGLDPKTGRPKVNPDAYYGRTGKMWLGMPGAPGGHSWMPMALNAQTGYVYIPAQEAAFPYVADKDFRVRAKGMNIGVDPIALSLPDDAKVKAAARSTVKGYLLAWDPKTQKEVWRAPHGGAWNGGVLSTAGNLVFQGNGDGAFDAYDAKNGHKLWSFDAQSGIVAAPISWAREGKQYVTIVVGWGGTFPLTGGEMSWGRKGPVPNRSRVLTFALNGTAKLPPPDAPIRRELVNVPQFANAQTIALGRTAYHHTCFACHGADAASGGIVPDLRYSPAVTDKGAWDSVVVEGVLKDQGMVGFKGVHSPAEIEAIRAYVIERAHVAGAARPRP